MKNLPEILVLATIILLFAAPSYAADNNGKQVDETELCERLLETQGKEKLITLSEIASRYWNIPEEESWLKKLYAEAAKQKNAEYEMKAAMNMCRYSHNLEEEGKLILWSERADSIAKANNLYNDDYFEAQAYMSKHYLWFQYFEMSAETATNLYKKADEVDNEYGRIAALEVLALTYQDSGRDSTAVKYFDEAIGRLEKSQEKHPNIHAQILTEATEACLQAGYLDKAETNIKKFVSIIRDIETEKTPTDRPFPVDRCYKLANCYYADLFTRENLLDRADSALTAANSIRQSDMYVDYLQNLAFARYYYARKNFGRAMEYVEPALIHDKSMPSTLILRGEIMKGMGNYEGAADDFLSAFDSLKKANTAAMDNAIAQQQKIHDISDLQLQLKDAKISEEHTKLLILMIISIILLTLLGLIISYLVKMRRLHKQIENDNMTISRANDELRVACARAEESDKLKRKFLENVNHEIRTPLNAIVGFSEVLTDAELTLYDNEKKEIVKSIRSNSDALLKLVNGILEVSTLQSGSYKMNITDCDVKECCDTALELIDNTIKPGVQLNVQALSGEFKFRTDKDLLIHALVELLDNAAKFTDNGSITITYLENKEKNNIEIAVTDTGCGIPPEYQDRVFKEFMQENDFSQGLGLGLNACSIIAKRLGGSVSLDKHYTGGARFILVLPL
ncbi:MAG: HAMP domain-containing histidine kinase [Bacteroidales bacterium]|jgi:signal transduction histidine kinase|nr:HAMP domain-containing histidine kinase [Bacteroidales bacterium]MCI2121274.1 HAMP domain-containing histidine kinase [Bacteroidales bacterium]MCI2146130.1 HAMP domain-containing histidine kinase [Bacteroidales bacterium]